MASTVAGDGENMLRRDSFARLRRIGNATTIASAASAWTQRRTAGRTPHQSSAKDTATTAAHGSRATRDRPPTAPGDRSATGRKPVQMAMPPTRDTGRSCSERSDGMVQRQAAAAQQQERRASPAESTAARTAASQGEYGE